MADSDEEIRNARLHQNQPYDESLDVPDDEEIASTYSPTPRGPNPSQKSQGRSRGETPPDARMSDQSEEDDLYDDRNNPKDKGRPGERLGPMVPPPDQSDDDDDDSDEDDDFQLNENIQPGPGQGQMGKMAQLGQVPQHPQQEYQSDDDGEDGSESSDEEDDDDDDDDDDEHVTLEGAYDPADYESLPVTPEIKELFQYITRYTPQSIELEHKLKPFIPDFIPSVGDIDAFIKVLRPDSKPDNLGLIVLDEPCAKQSDPTVLDLQLRALTKQPAAKQLIVKSLEDSEKNPKAIDNWVENIKDLHRSQPPPNVHYSKNMPDIETLMQEWPPEFEELLKEISLPTADLDCDLGQYVEMISAILDIPIYKGSIHRNEKIQALHVLFTLYSEFKNSQHFQALAEDNKLDNSLKRGGGMMDSDNLLL